MNVLSVEFNAALAPIIEGNLRDRGGGTLSVEPVTTVAEALAAAAAMPDGAILFDLDRPDGAGLEALRTLRRHAPQLPIIAISARTDDGFTAQALTAGAEDCLSKEDLSGPLVEQSLRHAIERRALRDQSRSQEREAQALKKRFLDCASASSGWFWEMGPDLRFTWFSEGWQSVFNQPTLAAIGKSREDLRQPDENDKAWCDHLADLEAHRPFRDFRYQAKIDETRTIWVRIDGLPYYDEDGTFLGYRGTGSDITAQIEAERSDAKHRGLLKDAVDAITDGFALYDADDRLVLCNSSYRSSLSAIADLLKPGVTRGTLLKALVERRQVIIPDGQDAAEWLLEQTTRKFNKHDISIQRKNDGQWFEVRRYETHDGGHVLIRADITAQKRYEEELRKLSMAVEQNPAGVFITDLNGTIEYANPAFEKLTGYTSEEAVGKNPRILQSGKTSPQTYKSLWNTIRAGRVWRGEILNKKKSGEEFWEYATVGVITDDDGTATHYVAIKEDISERKIIDEQLQYRCRELQIIGGILSAAMSSNDVGGASLTDILNLALETIVCKSAKTINYAARLFKFDSKSRHFSIIAESSNGIDSYDVSTRIPIDTCLCGNTEKSCKLFSLEHHGYNPTENSGFCSLLANGGEVLGALTLQISGDHVLSPSEINFLSTAAETLTTIISQRKSEKALRGSETRFRSITEAANDGILSFDNSLAIRSWNEAAERMFGYTADEAIGSNVKMIWPDLQDIMRSEKWQTLGLPTDREPAGATFEHNGTRKDGSEFPIEISLSSWMASGRREFTMIVRDISDRRNLEARLAQAQKMEAVGQLTGGVAHDFNNLLTVIVGNLGLAREHIGDDRVRKLVERAHTAGKHGADLISQLLAFSRTQALRPEDLDLNQVIGETTKLLGRTLGETVDIQIEAARPLWFVFCDPVQLRNALVNLSINARDAMPDGGTLTIATCNSQVDPGDLDPRSELPPGDYVRLSVTDTGTGMSPDILSRVFDPFFTTKEVGKGSGLGLSMVYGFVKQSGGHVEIDSEEGIGTSVRLYLPRALTADIDDELPLLERAVDTVDSGTVLVVEDDPHVRDTSVAVLEALGYDCLEAEDGHSALRVLEQRPEITLLFSDVIMPGGMTGPQLARQARARWPDLKILLTSGYARNAIPQNTDFDDGIELLPKPYDCVELSEALRRLGPDRPAARGKAVLGLAGSVDPRAAAQPDALAAVPPAPGR